MGSSKKGGGGGKIPQVDPQALIAQATAANRVGVNTPFGSQQYTTGPNGQTSLNTTLSPQMQAILAQQLQRAGAQPQQFSLPGGQDQAAYGLTQRLNARYGMPLPPPTGAGSTTGGADGPSPGATPSAPSPASGQDGPSPPAPVLAPPSGGGGVDGEFGECVVFDSVLPDGTRVDVLQPGAEQPCHLPGKGFHLAALVARGALAYVPCVRLVTDGGAIWRGSRTTPFTFVDASADLADGEWAYAPDMLDQRVFVRTRFGDVQQTVIEVQDIGDQWVVPLDFGGCSFAAGDTPDALVYSHNIRKGKAAYVNANVQGLGPWGSGPLTGTIGSSAVNAYAPSQNSYTPMGGYLGSGSYAGMGQGLAAANGTQPPPPAQTPTGMPGAFGSGAGLGSGFGGWAQNPAGGMTSGGSRAPSAPAQPVAAPHVSFGHRLAEALLPGRQWNKQTGQFNGVGSVFRGVGQLATGLPIATAYDIYRYMQSQNNPAPAPATTQGTP